MSNTADQFYDALISGDRIELNSVYNTARNQLDLNHFIEQVIVESLEKMGLGWEQGDIALSQVYMAGRMCEDLVDEILPPGDPNRKENPKIGISVLNDYHMLGKRIVYSVLRANGYDLIDYGRKEVDELVDLVTKDDLEILFLSVLMLPSALLVKQVVDQVRQSGKQTRIYVGGAPFRFDRQLWKEVGADGMGKTASDAISLIDQLKGGK